MENLSTQEIVDLAKSAASASGALELAWYYLGFSVFQEHPRSLGTAKIVRQAIRDEALSRIKAVATRLIRRP